MQKINTVQAITHQKQEQNEANKQMAMDLDTEQMVNAPRLSNILEKVLNEKLKKEKNKKQKNSSADAKIQASKATGHNQW